jgi:hypothetical protein
MSAHMKNSKAIKDGVNFKILWDFFASIGITSQYIEGSFSGDLELR